MDSVVGEDQTLPFDINGSCSLSRLPDSLSSADFSMDNMTASMFPGQKMSPSKVMTMKDYENQITALKKENFNLKLRIYFLEEHVQQKCDDSTEEIYKTNIELKVEVESMKRDLAEKQELLVSASKALESLAGRDSGEGLRERAQREMDALREAFNARIRELEESLRFAEEEVEKMASIAEQEKLRNLGLEKELEAANQSGSSRGMGSMPEEVHQLQQALQGKDRVIEGLQESIKNQNALVGELQKKITTQPAADGMTHLNTLIGQKDLELQALKDELDREKGKAENENQVCVAKQSELKSLQQVSRQQTEELNSIKSSNQSLQQQVQQLDTENKTLSGQLEEKDAELAGEKRNSLKRDKTIQGLGLLLKEKEKQVDELYGNLEEKDQALAKARDALHKAQLQKYQGGEEQQALLQSQHAELARLLAECHSSLLDIQRLQRALNSRDAQLELLQHDKLQLENELELLQQHKRKGDKTINDLQNQLKKLSGELAERENSLEHQRQHQQEQTRATEHKLQSTIQHLTSSLTQKEQKIQEYMSMVQDLEQERAPAGSDVMLAKLRERLREKEKALEKALDEKFSAVEEKENEIHQLQLNLREKERDLERLNNLLSHNDETINSFDALLKEKDVELQQLLNSLKSAQRSKQESEEHLQRALREKDSIIQQLQHTLQLKTKDLEEMASTVLNHSESKGRVFAEQMSQRLKVAEAMLSEAVKDKERLVSENQTAMEKLLASINSKDQLFKECTERHTQALSDRAAEIQDLHRQLTDAQLQLSNTQKLSTTLAEKDALINLLDHNKDRAHYLTEVKVAEASPLQVVELKQTIQVLQERLEEREGKKTELSRLNIEEDLEKSLTVSKKPVVILKKELAQKTEALNSSLKRENQLKIFLAELQSRVSELEGRLEGQTANIESLSSMISTKEEIIAELQQRLSLIPERQLPTAHTRHSQPGEELNFQSLPQRERTIIGGDSQQQELSSLGDLRSELVELSHTLKAEQHLYSNLVRAVKERDSAQHLQALQLELTAVTLLRQQLEDGVRKNTELREQLHLEIQRANQREGVDLAELESMRNALEEAQRWNTSLQARLGQMQSRGGGVGQASDMDDTLSLIGEQTSYMSICVGEGQDEDLQQLSVEQLKLKVSELQALNAELQRRLALAESSTSDNVQRESQTEAGSVDLSLYNKVSELQAENAELKRRLAVADLGILDDQRETEHLSPSNKQQQGPARPVAVSANKKMTAYSEKEKADETSEDQEKIGRSLLAQSRKGNENSHHASKHQLEDELPELALLLKDCGAESVSHLREQMTKLRLENVKVSKLWKEENSKESKESAESSGESDGHTDLRQAVQTLRTEARSHRKVIRMLKEQLQRNVTADGRTGVDPELIESMSGRVDRLKVAEHGHGLEDGPKEQQSRERNEGREQEDERERKKHGRPDQNSKSNNRNQKHHVSRHGAYGRSRLPVAVRPSKKTDKSDLTDHDTEGSTEQYSATDSEQPKLRSKHPRATRLRSSPSSSSEALWDSEARQNAYPKTKHNSDSKLSPDTVSDFQQSELLTQLELLNQECQEKEELISQLQLQMQDWEQRQAELLEKDKLNTQYLEALQAAESTIAYLTACSLDSGLSQQGSESDSSLRRRCAELQKAVQEKDRLNTQLLQVLNTAEAAIASLAAADRSESSSGSSSGQNQPQELGERLDGLLTQVKSLQGNKKASTGSAEEVHYPDGSSALVSDLRCQAESLQESLLRQCRLNAELQEKLKTAEETISKLFRAKDQQNVCSQRQPEENLYKDEQRSLVACLSECVLAAELALGSDSVITSLTTHQPESSSGFSSAQSNPEDLCGRLRGLLSQIKALQEQKNAQGLHWALGLDLQRPDESLQELLSKQCRLNAELQDKLRTAEETVNKLGANDNTPKHNSTAKSLEETSSQIPPQDEQHRLVACLSECVLAAERAVESVADLSSRSNFEVAANQEMQQNLDRLYKALITRDGFLEAGNTSINQSAIVGPLQHRSVQRTLQITNLVGGQQKTSTPNVSKTRNSEQVRTGHTDLHKNLMTLVQILRQNAQKVQALERKLKNKEDQGPGERVKSQVKPEEVTQLERLQEALKEKQNLCQRLEEKLATAQSIIALQSSSKEEKHVDKQKATPGEWDDKGIQVDVQDQGYETSGRSEKEVDREEGSSTDNLGTTASSLSYPSSPDLSSPRPNNSSADSSTDPISDPTEQIQQLRSQIKAQHKTIAHLQQLLRKKPTEILGTTSDPASRDEEEDGAAMRARIHQLTTELDRERTVNRSSLSGSPSRMESLVQSQARELCELREQIRVSRTLGAEQRKQLLELRGAVEELMPSSDTDLGTTLRKHLDQSLSLLDKLEQGNAHVDDDGKAGLELAQRLSAELREKDRLIQQLKDQLHTRALGIHGDSDSEMIDRTSNGSTTSVHDCLSDLYMLTSSRENEGTKETRGSGVPDTQPATPTECVAADAGMSECSEESVHILQRDNGRLEEKLRNTEELNATLKSELDLTRSILTQTCGQGSPQTKPTYTPSNSSATHTAYQNQATESHRPAQDSDSRGISSDLLMEHLQEVRALRKRLEETIQTNERLREQLEGKLLETQRHPETNIFIAGSEDPAQLKIDLRFLWAQNQTLKEQLNQAARDKQKENDRLREALSRRTAKLELSRKECETLREECTQLQDNLYRVQCEHKLQKQQLADTQQLLQSVQIELQVHEQIRTSIHTHTAEDRSSSESSKVDLGELLSEVRSLRLQLERSIQTNTALRHKLEQQLLTRTDSPSTININYLLTQTDESGKSEMLHLHSHHDPTRSANDADSGSSVRSGSPVLSRLVPGHRLWADRQGRHVLGLIEDYNALSKQIKEAKRLTITVDTSLQDKFVECAALSGSVGTMLQVLEEAGRLLKLFWRVSMPSRNHPHSQQDEVLRCEISQLRCRLSQQERMLTGAIKRLRSTNQLKEGMERIIIEQLSLTHGVLKKARGNLEEIPLNVQ
ncbi:CDK5 regulatory subunit-associated protein 2 isoform X2 [Trichomycterus rosablanca]|uniref:CDK5 regulatory subunit-associated protein 2 isoform X2 n=1 Tax=Trichomycterus rosablanca TaxID=2290929 RepID=UPI002F356713